MSKINIVKECMYYSFDGAPIDLFDQKYSISRVIRLGEMLFYCLISSCECATFSNFDFDTYLFLDCTCVINRLELSN